jgi:excisionase family DNA binding protein
MRDVPPLASRAEVAAYLGVPAATLTQWAHRGTGPRYTRIGRHAKYAWSDVDVWLEQQPAGGGKGAA